MKILNMVLSFCIFTLLVGCVSKQAPYDYTEYKNSDPRSILVLPPLNNTNEVFAHYSVLSNVTKPLAESGYYVFPVALVAETFKNNGLTEANDIHAIPPLKLHEIFDADTALYIEVKEYGTSYVVISSDTVVQINAKLIDLKTSAVIWEGSARAASSEQRSSSGGGPIGLLVEAALTQVLETVTDTGFSISNIAADRLLSAEQYNSLLYGPRSPKYGQPVKL